MKSAIGLHFSQIARIARVALLAAMVAALALLIAGGVPHNREKAPAGTEQNAPAERQPHYNFPTYA